MSDSVECPYCQFENDMSDGLTDLPNNNRFDHECENEACGREFEVLVEFEPTYHSEPIEYVDCEKCGKSTRDIHERGRTYPFPESLAENKVCYTCFIEGHNKDYEERKGEKDAKKG